MAGSIEKRGESTYRLMVQVVKILMVVDVEKLKLFMVLEKMLKLLLLSL
ncbi:MAG: hypothetical protein V8R51_05365 [Clostridia bacterium]